MKLVVLADLIPDAVIDLRYSQNENFTGQILYTGQQAIVPKLDEPAALALAQASDSLRRQGLFIVIWDSYRPETVQQQLRQINNDGNYVSENSNHCLGRAIDLTLMTSDGRYLDMGTDFDKFTPKAHANSQQIDSLQQANRQILKSAMKATGFKQWPYEWWHFDFIS